MTKNKTYHRVSADIDLNAIVHNIQEVRRLIKADTKLMAVIKADAYGHGAIPVAKEIEKMVDAFAVSNLEEGKELRHAGIRKEILILGYTAPEQIADAIQYHITMTIFEEDTARAVSLVAAQQKKEVKLHIKLDTGMNRIGFAANEQNVDKILEISRLPYIQIEGIFTHFARADEADKTATKEQFARFSYVVEQLKEKGLIIPICHVSNSAAILDLPEYNLDMVRDGICMYGMYPSDEVGRERANLKPAMQIKSHISYVKTVPAGEGISYNATYRTEREMRIATIPVGYGDGYPRRLSNCGHVLIHGKSVPIIGRICMDQFMVDVTEVPEVKQGDDVTLLGTDGTAHITAEELGMLSGSFHYEVVCDVGKRIPRVYYKDGVPIAVRALVGN